MIFFVLAKDKNIIDVNKDTDTNQIGQNEIHFQLEKLSAVFKPNGTLIHSY